MTITKEDINQREEFFNDLQSIIEREIRVITWDLSYKGEQQRFDDNIIYGFDLTIKVELEEESTTNSLYPRKEFISYSYDLDSYDRHDPFTDCSIYAYSSNLGALRAKIDVDKVYTAFTDYVDNIISYQDENFIKFFDNLITE